MAITKYRIELTQEETEYLEQIITHPEEHSERKVLRAKILLISDVSNPEKLSVPEIAERLQTSHTTVQTVRTTYGNNGVKAAVERKRRVDLNGRHIITHRSSSIYVPSKLKPEVIEQIAALKNSPPPNGKRRWTVRDLVEQCKNLRIVDISVSTMSAAVKRIDAAKEE